MGNPVSSDLPLFLDSFLQDVAQMMGPIDYRDIMRAKSTLNKTDLDYLKKVAREWNSEDAVKSEFLDTVIVRDRDGDPVGTAGRLKRILDKLALSTGKVSHVSGGSRSSRRKTTRRGFPSGFSGIR